MKRSKTGLMEVVAFTAAVLLYIWWLRFRAPWTILLLVAWAAACILRRETVESSGFSPRRFAEAAADWRYLWIGALVGLALVLQDRLFDPRLLTRGGLYLIWCCVQQAAYQNLVYRRVRSSVGPDFRAYLLSGLMFGAVHWPNPVLVPATLFWGVISSYLFERWPSVVALALVQWLFSSLLIELTPWQWHHGFRVGPGYSSPLF